MRIVYKKQSIGEDVMKRKMLNAKGLLKRSAACLMAGVLVFGMAGCGSKANDEDVKTDVADKTEDDAAEETEIQVFIAASLNTVMTELAEKYNEEHPEVKIVYNADSSGTLMTQIQEGYECDLFFSAA